MAKFLQLTTFSSLLIGLLHAGCAEAAPGPPVFAAGQFVAVGTHIGQQRVSAAQVKAATAAIGVHAIRDEVYWRDVETIAGQFSPNSRGRAVIAELLDLVAQGVRLTLVLGYGNPLYDGGGQPTTVESVAAFARYARWIAERFPDADLEIWNEWNIGAGSRPRVRSGSAAAYSALASTTLEQIRWVAPDATVLCGGLADDLDGWPWLRRALAAGGLEGCDGISVHLYNHSMSPYKATPEEMLGRLRSLRSLLDTHYTSKTMPIHITEVGWPTHTGRTGTSTALASAKLMQLLASLPTIRAVHSAIVYELFNRGTDVSAREDNFGLFNVDGSARPQACAVGEFQRLLTGFQFVSYEVLGMNRVATFRDGVRYRQLVWRSVSTLGQTASLQSSRSLVKAPVDAMRSAVSVGCPPIWNPGVSAGATDTLAIGTMPLVVAVDDGQPLSFSPVVAPLTRRDATVPTL